MTMTLTHGPSYRELFTHPEMIRMLIEGFIPTDLLEGFDSTKIEIFKDPAVPQELTHLADMVWKIPHTRGAQPLYMALWLEPRDEADPFMALHILEYIAFLYEAIMDAEPSSFVQQSLPPVLPLVFYTGLTPWSAPLQLRELFACPQDSPLFAYLPSSEYLLIDAGHIPAEELDRIDSPLALMIKLERLVRHKMSRDQVEQLAGLLAELLEPSS